jgi:hypothetical protein
MGDNEWLDCGEIFWTVARFGACCFFASGPGAYAPWLLTIVPLALGGFGRLAL